ncbi:MULTISPECIES: hypothetical protein [unclassified Streptomyces]|nr:MULTISPECIES: hypothetical protein [unclassified Streptomyces]
MADGRAAPTAPSAPARNSFLLVNPRIRVRPLRSSLADCDSGL